jgi:hypothetical protein
MRKAGPGAALVSPGWAMGVSGAARASAGQHRAPCTPRGCRYFYATLRLGTPPKPFTVIVDTGSTITYVPCSTCRRCGRHQVRSAIIHRPRSHALQSCSWLHLACAAPPSAAPPPPAFRRSGSSRHHAADHWPSLARRTLPTTWRHPAPGRRWRVAPLPASAARRPATAPSVAAGACTPGAMVGSAPPLL